MIQLTPQEKFPIVRQLEDPSDSNTYYVKALIRDSGSGKTIATLHLDNKGNQRFTANWEVLVPEGTFVDITSLVYTDSGYTTLSTVYGCENDTYIAQTRWGIQFMPAPSRDVNYEKIEGFFKKSPPGSNSPIKKVDFKPLHQHLDRVAIQVLKVNEPKVKLDITPLIKAIDRIERNITGINSHTTDNLSPLLTAIKNLSQVFASSKEDMSSSLVQAMKEAEKHLETIAETFKEEVKKTKLNVVIRDKNTPEKKLLREKINKLL